MQVEVTKRRLSTLKLLSFVFGFSTGSQSPTIAITRVILIKQGRVAKAGADQKVFGNHSWKHLYSYGDDTCDKAALTKAAPHASSKSPPAPLPCRASLHGPTVFATLVTLTPMQYRAQSSAAAKSVPEHAGIAEIMGHELAWIQY